MALRTAWKTFFVTAGIPGAKNFHDNRVTDLLLPDLTKKFLTDHDITIIGDILLTILQHAKQAQSITINQTYTIAKAPKIAADMTCPQFRKFNIDWTAYKNITGIPTNQIPSQLYSLCADSVQTTIINTKADFFTLPGDDLLKTIVTQKFNPQCA